MVMNKVTRVRKSFLYLALAGIGGLALMTALAFLLPPESALERIATWGFVWLLLGSLLFLLYRDFLGHWAQLQSERRETLAILDHLGQGVLFFDSHLKIQDFCSSSIQQMFGTDPTQRTLPELLRLDGAAKSALVQWADMTFSQMMPFEDMRPLAPQTYQKASRYLTFEYRPIFDAKGVRLDRVLLIVTDRTEEKKMRDQREVEISTARVVMAILKNKEAFQEFIRETRRLFQDILSEVDGRNLTFDVQKVLRALHTLKGLFPQFHILHLTRPVTTLENELVNVVAEGSLRMPEFVEVLRRETLEMIQRFENLVQEHAELIGPLEADTPLRTRNLSVQSIYKMSQILSASVGVESEAYREFVKEFVLEDIANGLEKYRIFVEKLAARQGKQVDFQIVVSGINVCLESYRSLLSAMVHVFRNAVDHGIETGSQRVARGKPERGVIQVSFSRVPLAHGTARLRIIVRDDGLGIDVESIRKRLISRKIVPAEKAAKLDERTVLQYVFRHGMTTRDEVTDISGRGVGLDTVKYEASKLGGTAWVESTLGKETRLILEVPIYETQVFRPVDRTIFKEGVATSKKVKAA